jgi:hypothetical protein
VPREDVHEDRTEDVREEVYYADPRPCVRPARREPNASRNRDDFDRAVNTAKERDLELTVSERGDDELALVCKRVGDVVERGEERE